MVPLLLNTTGAAAAVEPSALVVVVSGTVHGVAGNGIDNRSFVGRRSEIEGKKRVSIEQHPQERRGHMLIVRTGDALGNHSGVAVANRALHLHAQTGGHIPRKQELVAAKTLAAVVDPGGSRRSLGAGLMQETFKPALQALIGTGVLSFSM